MIGSPEQGREAGARIEARQAEPVDRPLPRHEGAGVTVADQRVVFDGGRHGPVLSRTMLARLTLYLLKCRNGWTKINLAVCSPGLSRLVRRASVNNPPLE